MNDNFGDISQDFLQEGYGDIPSKVIQGTGVPHPTATSPGQAAPVHSSGPSLPPHTSSEAPGPTATRMTSPVVDSYAGASGPSRLDIERQMFWGCLSGLPGVARKNAAALKYVDHGPGTDGYKYRQYSDGSVEIIDPSPKNVGKKYAAGSTAALKVEQFYGKYTPKTSSKKKSKKGKTGTSKDSAVAAGAAVGAGLSQLVQGFLPLLGPQAATPLDEASLTITEDAPPAPSGTPWGLILGGVAAVAVVGGVIYFVMRKPKTEE